MLWQAIIGLFGLVAMTVGSSVEEGYGGGVAVEGYHTQEVGYAPKPQPHPQPRGYRPVQRVEYKRVEVRGYGKPQPQPQGYGKPDEGYGTPKVSYGKPQPQPQGYGTPNEGYGPPKVGYGGDQGTGYKQESYHKTETHYYKPAPPPPPPVNQCYQCTWAPKQKYKHTYGREYHGAKQVQQGAHQYGGYYEHTRVGYNQPGWDKCQGPFNHYEAKANGVDVWNCHYNNCYIRKDKNGHVFRGCYKGEFGVDQNLFGCNYQAGSLYCFCKGSLCNNGPVPH